jgi:hypothetical protein
MPSQPGILAGCALAHIFQAVSTLQGATSAGRLAVSIGLAVSLAYAAWVVLAVARSRVILSS